MGKVLSVEYVDADSVRNVHCLRVKDNHNFYVVGENSENKPVLVKNCYVPLEMTEIESLARISANVSGMDITKILLKKLTNNERKKIFKSMMDYAQELKKNETRYTIFSPPEDMTAEEILLTLKPYGYRVVIIDYISLLKGVDSDDAWQQLGKVARFCKIWAKNNNMIVVLLAQVNQDGMLRYAKAIGEHANNFWSFVVTEETREQGILPVKQMKARNQQMFNFELALKPEFMRVYDVDDAQVDSDLDDTEETKTVRVKQRKGEKGDEYLDDVGGEQDAD